MKLTIKQMNRRVKYYMAKAKFYREQLGYLLEDEAENGELIMDCKAELNYACTKLGQLWAMLEEGN